MVSRFADCVEPETIDGCLRERNAEIARRQRSFGIVCPCRSGTIRIGLRCVEISGELVRWRPSSPTACHHMMSCGDRLGPERRRRTTAARRQLAAPSKNGDYDKNQSLSPWPKRDFT